MDNTIGKRKVSLSFTRNDLSSNGVSGKKYGEGKKSNICRYSMNSPKKRKTDTQHDFVVKAHTNNFGNRPFSTFKMRLTPFEKNFFQPTIEMMKRPTVDIANYRHEHKITIEGNDIPSPIMTFTEYEFPDCFMEEFEKQKFECPTPIQAQSWPVCLSGRDFIGIARTGSGKTLAYILPAIIHINHQKKLKEGDGPIAIILAPTRELVQQIHQVIKLFEASAGIRSACIFGGAGKKAQAYDLMNGPEICVATPGRFIDFLSTNLTNVNRCTYLCLDEADMMLDLGFDVQIRNIITKMRRDRQNVMFSATWPKGVRTLADDYLKDPITLRIGSTDLSANHNIAQIVDVCSDYEKDAKLSKLLEEILGDYKFKVLIFVATKSKVEELTIYMNECGWKAYGIHGAKCQTERDYILNRFRNGSIYLLIATDVAARGLDVDDIKIVINYDYPKSSEGYVHRIGRTARHENAGTAYTFFTGSDSKNAKRLIDVLTEAKQLVNPLLYGMVQHGGGTRMQRYKDHYDGGLGYFQVSNCKTSGNMRQSNGFAGTGGNSELAVIQKDNPFARFKGIDGETSDKMPQCNDFDGSGGNGGLEVIQKVNPFTRFKGSNGETSDNRPQCNDFDGGGRNGGLAVIQKVNPFARFKGSNGETSGNMPQYNGSAGGNGGLSAIQKVNPFANFKGSNGETSGNMPQYKGFPDDGGGLLGIKRVNPFGRFRGST